MKFLILLFISNMAMALPIFNRNVASSGNLITIWPDHQDPNQFYFAPNFLRIAEDKNKKAKFHIIKFKGDCEGIQLCKRKALLTSFFEADIKIEELEAAKASILKRLPQARFSPAPFFSSRVDFGSTLNPFIDTHSCSPSAGQTSDEVPCMITLNRSGVKILLPSLAEGKVLPFNFYYQMSGVIQNAKGEYLDYKTDYSIVVNLGGEMILNHEDLI